MKNELALESNNLVEMFVLRVTKGYEAVENISYTQLVKASEMEESRKWVRKFLRYFKIKRGDTLDVIREKIHGYAISYRYTGGEIFVDVFINKARSEYELYRFYMLELSHKFPENIHYSYDGVNTILLIKTDLVKREYKISRRKDENNQAVIESLKDFIARCFSENMLLSE